jgi:hypothetical protein
MYVPFYMPLDPSSKPFPRRGLKLVWNFISAFNGYQRAAKGEPIMLESFVCFGRVYVVLR